MKPMKQNKKLLMAAALLTLLGGTQVFAGTTNDLAYEARVGEASLPTVDKDSKIYGLYQVISNAGDSKLEVSGTLIDEVNTTEDNITALNTLVGDPTTLSIKDGEGNELTTKTLVSNLNQLADNVGKLGDLSTTANTTIVSALNELDGDLGTMSFTNGGTETLAGASTATATATAAVNQNLTLLGATYENGKLKLEDNGHWLKNGEDNAQAGINTNTARLGGTSTETGYEGYLNLVNTSVNDNTKATAKAGIEGNTALLGGTGTNKALKLDNGETTAQAGIDRNTDLLGGTGENAALVLDNGATTAEAGINTNTLAIWELQKQTTKGIARGAAMAALHPLDYKGTGSKLDFQAGLGTYRDEAAVALGVSYHPNRDVMLSLGTTVTGDDDLLNVSASFKIGRSGKSQKQTLREQLAAAIEELEKKADAQEKRIEMLKEGKADNLAERLKDPAFKEAFELGMKYAK